MEYLDKIIVLINCIFEVYIFFDFFHHYFDYQSHCQLLWKRIGISLCAAVGLFGIHAFGSPYLNLWGSIIIIWLYMKALFQANSGTKLLCLIVSFSVSLGCEFLFGIFLHIPFYFHNQNSFIYLAEIPWYLFSIKLLTYIILIIIKQFTTHPQKLIDQKIFVFYLCIPISSLIIMLLIYYSGVNFSISLLTKALISVSFALVLFGNIFIFCAFYRYTEELYKITEQKLIMLRQVKNFNQTQTMEDKYQEYIHNISHHLKTIGELAKENRNSNIISIVQDLNIDLENNILTLYCSNVVLNAILSEKKSVAERNDIEMDIYVEPCSDFIKISDMDIITMLGNLLDNATQAAANADYKRIKVRIYKENEGCFHIIKIENRFSGQVYRIEQRFLSTKEEQGIHGIGIRSVEKTAEKYGGYLECFIEKNLFTAVLVLPILE